MKKLFALLIAAAISIGASAATLLPIQLLDPTGSTSGQAIISTGTSSSPAWGAPSIPAGTTIPTPNITGVTNGTAAAAGSVGEIITSTVTAVSLTSGTPTNATSISLTAGQWDVYGSCTFVPTGTTAVSSVFAGASKTTATFPASPLLATFETATPSAFTGTKLSLTIPSQPINVSSTTTVFMVMQAGFAASTLTADCNLWGERRR
jgi:hypothetical protein